MVCLLPAVLKVEFSISSCVFLWNSFPVYLSTSEIPVHLFSRSPCEVMGWCYSCSVIWSCIMYDPEEIVHWSIPHERWLGPQFQSSSTVSVGVHFPLTAASFCAHTTSGSQLQIYCLSKPLLNWLILNHKNWKFASERESSSPWLPLTVLTCRLDFPVYSHCLINYEPSSP